MIVCSTCGKENQVHAHFCNWCGAAMSSTSPTGRLPSQTLLHHGRYIVVKLLGQGGMGAVYKALDLHAQQRAVAIKEMSQSGLSSVELQEAISSFTHEATLLAHLNHSSLPRIYQQFEENSRRYLVMDFIEGITLEQHRSDYQQQGKRVPLGSILDIAIQLCSVLDYLHVQQPPIIFRDLKPDNIMLTPKGQAYLIDFGIARLFKPEQTKDTIALGSPGYASPEQYNKATSPRSDIYSLGAVLHQLLTGDDPSQKPFQFKAISINNPLLEDLVMSMVQINELDRPDSMKHVREVLQLIAQKLTQPKTGNTDKQAALNAAQVSSIRPVNLYVLTSTAQQDQQIWQSIQKQLAVLMNNIPNIRIVQNAPVSLQDSQASEAAIDRADLLLVVLSEDFLRSPACMTSVQKALSRGKTHEVKIYSLLARPCNWQKTPMASLPQVLADPIAHLSLYAQEQQISAAARAIRKQLTAFLLAGQQPGPMNLLQWLLWQLYGNGGTGCPYFVVKQYALKYIRPSGQTGVLGQTGALFQLLNLKTNQVIADYSLSSHNSTRLTPLLQIIAPSCTAPLYVLGVGMRKHP
jgi:serine/threonine protein kinase